MVCTLLRGVAHPIPLQEEQLGRSTFSGNYTLIRDLYTEGGANFTTIVPRDLYGSSTCPVWPLVTHHPPSSYGLVPGGIQTFNTFWGSFLWNGT